MIITANTDPSKLPNQSQPQEVFDANYAEMIANYPLRAQQENALAAALDVIAAGGAYSLSYVFDATTADADPTAGKLRLNNATQQAAGGIRVSTTSNGVSVASILDMFDDSTSTIKGSIKLTKRLDSSKWITFDLTALTSPAGYRNINVACTGFSGPNPFANGDPLLLTFQRVGDKGEQGVSGFTNMVVLTTSQSWVCAANISKGEVTVVDGGTSGAFTTGASSTDYRDGGKGGNAGVSILALTPGGTYTATIGAGGSGAASSAPGGATSFAGPGITTLTSANASLKVPGGLGDRSGSGISGGGSGGGTLLAPGGSDGYGAGGVGGSGSGSAGVGAAGKAGVIIIRF